MMTQRKLTIVLILLSTALELGTSSCATTVPRPDTNVCVTNVPGLRQDCRNLLKDYDDNGNLKPGTQPTVIQYKDEADMLAHLNKSISTDPDGWANLKAYIRDLRAEQGRQGN